MNIENMCPGCMTELADGSTSPFCPNCGYNLQEEGEAHRLKPRTRLHEKYIVGKVLGEGGFGITYLGYDTTLEMKVAIKEYYPAGFASRDVSVSSTVTAFTGEKGEFYANGKGKFIKEARTLAKFSGLPGIVSVRDFFEENNTSYIIMEYLQGETLKAYLKRMGGVLAPAMVANMLDPVIKSLAQVHKQGIIHRDISPDNMMILPDGTMKLLDFGAAREQSTGEKSVSVMLKPGYAPEEQYRTHGNQGPWTDVYGICGTIYRCLTGHAPVEAMERMRQDTLKSPYELGIAIEPWQSAALMHGLSLYAENRFQTMEEFYNAYYLNQLMPPQMQQMQATQQVFHEISSDDEVTTMPLEAATLQNLMNAQGGVAPSFAPQAAMGQMPQGDMNMAAGGMQPGLQPNMQPGMQNPSGNVGPQYIYGNQAAQADSKKKVSGGLIAGIVAGGVLLLGGGITAAVLLWPKGDGQPQQVASVDITPDAQVTITADPQGADVTDVPVAPGTTDIVLVDNGYFTTDYSQTVRGHAIGDFYNDYVMLMADGGVDCGQRAGGNKYTDHYWYAKMNDGIQISSIAVYEDTLYLACGESGIVTSDITQGGTMPIIVNGDITSFALADGHLFYIDKSDVYSSDGTLYVANADGTNPTKLMNKVHCIFMRTGSSDFEYVDGKMYFLGSPDGSYYSDLYRCNADGSDLEMVCDLEDYTDMEGLYYNGGKLYTTTNNGKIYTIDLDTMTAEQFYDAKAATYMPLVFSDGALLYADSDWEYRCIYNGEDKKLVMPDTYYNVYLDAVDGEILGVIDYTSYAGVPFANGEIGSFEIVEDLSYNDAVSIDDSAQTIPSTIIEKNTDYRAYFMAAIDPNQSWAMIKNNQWDNNHFVVTSRDGYYALNSDEKVRYFGVINDAAYYTVANPDDTFELRKQELWDGAPSESVNGIQACMFCIYEDRILYENYADNYALYLYDPSDDTNKKIVDDAIGYYYILNECLYYEDFEEQVIKRLDFATGDIITMLSLADNDVSALESFVVFNCNDATYFAFLTKEAEFIVCSDDGSVGEVFASDLQEFDLMQDLYYYEGCIYYCDGNGAKIHRLEIDRYITDASLSEAPDSVVFEGNIALFEISDDLLFVELYDGNNEVLALDPITAEEYNRFDFEV